MIEYVDILIRKAGRCLDVGADLVMIDADGVSRHSESLPTDAIAKIIGCLSLEKLMFEVGSLETLEWFVGRYGSRVSLFVQHSHVGKFVEFYGDDHVTLEYLKLIGRSDETINMIEAYLRAISVGVKVGQLENDASAMMTHKTKVVTGLTKRIEGFFKQNKVTYVKGAGKIVFGSKVSVDLLDGGNSIMKGRAKNPLTTPAA
ncbi:hypothetical protein SUGI_0794400 [Cryptomeria japonica]|nr:hypothetical protein SUGI_0794400 [Cryptomeria japonica]